MQQRDSHTDGDPLPIDLSVLDPDRDRDAEARLVRRVMAGRHQSYPIRDDLLLQVWATDRRWLAGVAALAATLLIALELTSRPAAHRPRSVEESIGVPPLFLSGASPESPTEAR